MRYLVTGGAGFIGSNLVEELLRRGEEVVILDDLSTGKKANIESFMNNERFTFKEGTITDPETCVSVCEGVDFVLHQAAVCSVQKSIEDPITTHKVNVTGTVNILLAARDAGVKRVVWASSTSVYGNSTILPNIETNSLSPLSPYAASKAASEMYAYTFSKIFDMSIISLRYFNVFGRRQDPFSQYAAVIPIFISKLLRGEQPRIFGDGEQTRDFVYIDNVIMANINAATQSKPEASGHAFNIGCGKRISINELYNILADELNTDIRPIYCPPRPGDVRDSIADISAAEEAFGYKPVIELKEGLIRFLEWYKQNII